MPWVSFHTFRHTCASLLFANGKDIKQIQTWLGHADAGFTLRTYVHLLEEGVGSADFSTMPSKSVVDHGQPIVIDPRISGDTLPP
jgi:integrase